MEKENLDEQNSNGIKPDVMQSLPSFEKQCLELLTEYFLESIKDNSNSSFGGFLTGYKKRELESKITALLKRGNVA